MADQVTGYRYFTNFLLFIGNPIENLLGINFDKRGWIYGERVPMGDNGSLIYLESPNLYGENEGGVSGTLNLKLGTNIQTEDKVYKNYMESIGLQASAYPYQSYISFTGGGLSNSLENLTEEQLQELANQYNNGIIPGRGFYVGNSGYMKEMLLWPKRIHVRNDGCAQWYDLKAEIGEYMPYSKESNNFVQGGVVFTIKQNRDIPAGITFEASTDCIGGIVGNFDYSLQTKFSPAGAGFTISDDTKKKYGIYDLLKDLEIRGNGYNASENDGIFLDHADAWYPNWESVKTRTMNNSVVVNSVGFSTLYLVELKSRTKHTNFTIDFGSDNSYLVSNKVINNFGDGYVQGRCIAIYLYDGDTAVINFTTENDLNSDTYLAVRSNLKCIVADYEIGINKKTIEAPDINPIHKIREILTDDTAMNKPESSVNNENFIKAADRIYDERLGISWSITEKSCIDAINELCYHIEAGIRVNRQTGLYEMVLFRDDWFEEDEIHTIVESKIKSMQYEITNADEVINQVNVNYYDRANIKNSSFSISESGLIQTLNRINAETLDFPYFMNMRNAEIVANWKLKQLSTGAFKGSFTTGWREARKWNRYDLIRLPWSKRWIGTILVRIMSINLGGPTNNEVSIDFIEIVPSTGMMNTSIIADEPIDKPLPPQACQYEPFELPYYLAVMLLGQRQVDDELTYEKNFGLVGVVAEKPQSNSLYAIMKTHNGVEGEEWLRAASIQYSETADLDQIISRTSNSFTVKNWKKIANVPIGTLIQCGREWLTGLAEWMVFQGVDPYTGIISVKRGALDTQPQEWDLGLKLYFCGNDVAYDETEYVSGEEVLVSALTATPSGVLEQKGSNQVEMKARAIRPYPPANVKINGEYWPTEIETDLVLTWVDRNRLQQTGGSILGWFDSSVTLETGATYQLILIEIDENDIELRTRNLRLGALNTYTLATSAMQVNTRKIEIILKSIREGYECYQAFNHIVELSQFFSAPYDLTVEFKND